MPQPIRPEHADKVEPVAGADARFTIGRRLLSYAYPANGNVHNPTPRYVWTLYLDGRQVDWDSKKSELTKAVREYGVAGYT